MTLVVIVVTVFVFVVVIVVVVIHFSLFVYFLGRQQKQICLIFSLDVDEERKEKASDCRPDTQS